MKSLDRCTACGLSRFTNARCQYRARKCDWFVFSESPTNAELACVEPGVGAWGDVLFSLLFACDIMRNDVVIAHLTACRACNGKCLQSRDPESTEVLACMPNMLEYYKECNPSRGVILLGEVTKRYYKSEFPEAICITHPAIIMSMGGIGSPLYRQTLRKLKESLC